MVLSWLKRGGISTSLDKFKRERLCVCVFVYAYMRLMLMAVTVSSVCLLMSAFGFWMKADATNHNPILNPKSDAEECQRIFLMRRENDDNISDPTFD